MSAFHVNLTCLNSIVMQYCKSVSLSWILYNHVILFCRCLMKSICQIQQVCFFNEMLLFNETFDIGGFKQTIIIVQTSCDAFKLSFWPRTINNLNCLPSNIFGVDSSDIFEVAAKCFFCFIWLICKSADF